MSKAWVAHPQPGMLLPPPPSARPAEFALRPGASSADARAALESLLAGSARIDGTAGVLGLGLAVKGTAQESIEPEAFVLRRSMPWSGPEGAGLVFVAFGNSLDPFGRQMRRMAGLDDGIVDGLFAFTRPVSGAYYWCPPVAGGRIALPR